MVDGANNVLQSGAAADGSTITFRGASLKFTGTAAAGDSFSITPSGAQDMFAMIDQLAKLLVQPQDTAAQRAQFQTALQHGLGTLQAAEDQLIDTRSGIGIRLNAINDARDVAAAQSEPAATAAPHQTGRA